MLSDEKILVTGPAGQVAFPLAARLAAANDVWGIARFTDAASRERCETAGITTRVADLATGDFGDLPTDFTYLLHIAAFVGGGEDFDDAIAINAEGTGLVMQHCRSARAALVMSTASVYRPNDDPWFAHRETDPLGDGRLPFAPTYSISKIAQEAVARTCSRLLGLPTVVTRINCPFGANGGLLVHHLDAVVAGRPITMRWDPNPYSPIHETDVAAQLEAVLDAASVGGTIVNWGHDDPISMQDACRFMGELTGRPVELRTQEIPGTARGSVTDPTRRRTIAGPCTVSVHEGIRTVYEERYPDGPDRPPRATGPAARSLADP